MKKFFILCFALISLSGGDSYAQSKTLEGHIITDDFRDLPGVLIVINDTVKVGTSELKGFFQIDIPDSVRKISFHAIGMEEAYIELADNCKEVELVMLSASRDCFISPKKSNRLRMRRLKKVPELHKQAFEKGLFKTDKACYIRKLRAY